MSEPSYYVKRVRRDDNGKITHLKTSKELQGQADKVRKEKKVAKHVKNGKHIRTAFLDDGMWLEGDKLVLSEQNNLKTEGNREKRDNLGSLESF